jgi:hypothetical protein
MTNSGCLTTKFGISQVELNISTKQRGLAEEVKVAV